MKKLSISIFIFFLFSIPAFAQQIISIKVEGNLRTDKETVLSVVNSKVGSKLNPKTIDEDILNIYGLGFYKTVSAWVNETGAGDVLIFKVKEKPSVRYIMFEGNSEISDKKLEKALKIKPYNILNKKLIEETINNIIGMYAAKSRYLTSVSYTLKKVPENRVDIVFHIKESKKGVIRDINIIGNKHISTSDLETGLSNHVKNGPYILTFLPWFYTGKLRINDLENDRQKIIDKYLSKGYLDVKVSEPLVSIEPDTGNIHIDIHIKEGEPYILKSISFKNIEPLTKKELLETLSLKLNKPFNMVKLRQGIRKITDMYGDKGYAFADINPIIHKDKENHTATLELDVDKGPKVYISRIEITGNVRTHDNVIRRELELKEGDVYSTAKIEKSKQHLINLDYFKNVKIMTKRVGKNKIKMIVHVSEKRTGMLSFGVGYGTYTKFGVQGSLSETNLFGTGIHAKLSANLTTKSSYFNLNLVNPWWKNRPISLGVNIFHEKYDSYDYTEKTTGIVPSIAKRFWDQTLSVGIQYALTTTTIDLDTNYPSYYLKQQAGSYLESALMPFVTYNTLNNYILPTRGVNASLNTTFAGLGGNRKYLKAVLFGEYFHPLFWDFVGHIKAQIGAAQGYGGKDVPINKRFFLGGINDMRGFEVGKLSPKDKEGNYIGGDREAYGSAELIFPIIGSLNLYGALFCDIGNVWLNNFNFGNLRYDSGFEIRWISPLGPIRISIAKNLSPRNGEQSTVFQFSMGALF